MRTSVEVLSSSQPAHSCRLPVVRLLHRGTRLPPFAAHAQSSRCRCLRRQLDGDGWSAVQADKTQLGMNLSWDTRITPGILARYEAAARGE